MFLPAGITHVRLITVWYPVQRLHSMYAVIPGNCFFLRPEVGRWPSNTGGTVGPLYRVPIAEIFVLYATFY